jgi:hypothetical protein
MPIKDVCSSNSSGAKPKPQPLPGSTRAVASVIALSMATDAAIKFSLATLSCPREAATADARRVAVLPPLHDHGVAAQR